MIQYIVKPFLLGQRLHEGRLRILGNLSHPRFRSIGILSLPRSPTLQKANPGGPGIVGFGENAVPLSLGNIGIVARKD